MGQKTLDERVAYLENAFRGFSVLFADVLELKEKVAKLKPKRRKRRVTKKRVTPAPKLPNWRKLGED